MGLLQIGCEEFLKQYVVTRVQEGVLYAREYFDMN
jgi:hypothetical protein